MFGKSKLSKKKSIIGFLFILPALATIIAMVIYPVLYSFNLSLHSFNILKPGLQSQFVGLSNYIKIISDKQFLSSLLFTFEFVFLTIILELVVGFVVALILNKELKGNKIFRVITTLPLMIAPVVAGLQWRWLYADQYGLINYILSVIGIRGPLWLSTVTGAKAAILISNVWLASPFVILILLAGLSSLPQSPFEAAKIDGANSFQMFFKVTLPLLKPFLLIILIVRVTDAFRIFDLVYILTQGGPGGSTEVVSTYIYKEAFTKLNLSEASAASFIMVIIMGLISVTVYKLFRPKEEGVL